MCYHRTCDRGYLGPVRGGGHEEGVRLVADGGTDEDDAESGDDNAASDDAEAADAETADVATDDGGGDEGPPEAAEGSPDDGDEAGEPEGTADPAPGVDGSNVEVTDEAEPAEPKWEEPNLDELPEFELGAEGPLTKGVGSGSGSPDSGAASGGSADPGAGMPNTARSPEATRISSEGTEAYVVAFEVCAKLPDDVRLPEDAADLVPAAVEAELEEDVQQFAAAEFGTQTPHVDTLAFEDVDGEVWLRLRIGLPPEQFDDLDPEAVRSYALEQLEGVL